MPQCRKLVAHPAHLVLLHGLVNTGEATTIDALFRAKRVMDAIEDAVNPTKSHPEPVWIDPSQVRTREDYLALGARKGPDGQSVIAVGARWDPDERLQVLFAQDEYDHAVRCFEKGVARAIGAQARSLLDLKKSLDGAEVVTASA